MTAPERRIGFRDHLFGAALMIGYLVLLMATASDLGMSRDESFYATSAETYAHWFEALAADRESAFYKDFIDQIWRVNREHPALIKSLFSLSYLAHRRWELFRLDSLGFRFPAMVGAGLLLWLIYIFGARVFGRPAGAFAAAAFALMPRIFYHAHLAAFDVPIALMITWTTYAYWRSLASRRWALLTGIAFGAALATKHNSWMLPGIFAVHFLWLSAVELWMRRRTGTRRLTLFPFWLLSMAALGPAILVGSWPWLWTDTWPRLAEYAEFHLHHVYYNMAYFGVNYFRPPFPVSYSWVMTLFTVPLTTLLLGAAGAALSRRSLAWPLFSGRPPTERPAQPADHRCTELLLFGSMLAPLVVMSLPSTPIFGGTKHWFPAYPFLALFAGAGFSRVLDACRELLPRISPAAVTAVCASALLAPSALETAHSHPFGLSHYGLAAGGVPGAADHGMNRQFWGFTTGSLVDFFGARLPGGGTVWICDTTYKAWEMFWRDGLLPRDIRPVSSIADADYAIVHHEHHFAEVDFQIWTVYGTLRPTHVLTYDGVPIVSVYRNPRSGGSGPR